MAKTPDRPPTPTTNLELLLFWWRQASPDERLQFLRVITLHDDRDRQYRAH